MAPLGRGCNRDEAPTSNRKALAEEVERGSFWIWLRRRRTWGQANTEGQLHAGAQSRYSLPLLRRQEMFRGERSETPMSRGPKMMTLQLTQWCHGRRDRQEYPAANKTHMYNRI